MTYSILKTQNQDGILTITISRPDALNALNTAFFNEMDNLLDEVAKDDSVKVIVLTGEGKAFVAGADIAEMVDKNSSEGTQFSQRGQSVFRKMEKLDKPIIAAINGFALGGGLELALACDIRLASSKAKFGQPEVNLGLIPGFAATQRLPRLIGTGNALWLLMTAEMIDAAEALRIGLVQKVFEPDVLMESAMAMAQLIASKGLKAVKKMKMVVRQGMEMDFDAGNQLEADEFGSLFGNEGEEGMRAFLEKRKANFSGTT
jgi:enoyl-CoA hydratase